MENKVKIGIVFSIATVAAAFSIIFATQYRRRRNRNRHQHSCYLHSEQKPQFTFKRVEADNSYTPFKHLKLNESSNEKSLNVNPYEAEITALLEKPQIDIDFVSDDLELKMSDTYMWIETEDKLQELVDVLSKERVFAVDTEQHSLRSFLGFTALIQISTQKEDYLVDTIALHDKMWILRLVFADPKICKVFHGADNDVLWLQRDFHIYVVNLFDTAKACDMLSKPQRSLAYLLETYCGVTTNKILQREDWRQRPLPLEMVQYARTDAHYLMYIANCLIAELKKQNNASNSEDINASEYSSCHDDTFNFLLEASRRSNMICLQYYTKEIEDFPGESAASSILSRNLAGQGGFSSKTCDTQFQDLVRQLCAWRDLMARIHDESLRFVLSELAIVALADKVPRTRTEIYSTISQADLVIESVGFNAFIPTPSPIVCSHVDDLCCFFQDKIKNPDDYFQKCLQKHLGPNGSCPLSIFNYALLSKSNLKLVNRLVPKQNGVKHSKQVSRKASRELFVQKFSCKSPVYHNCRIYANDGRLLCYCDRRKLEWYVRRDLAKLLDESPPAIMLLFEPKGRPEDEDNDFYVQTKKNICVGCGEKNHYLRYRIIPSCYRIHFPEHLKSHRSHDIVLLCVDCHEVAHAAAERYKKQIAAELGIPLFVQKVVDSRQVQAASTISASAGNLEEEGVSPLQLRTAAMALLRHGPRMPYKRREELIQTVMKYYGGREISDEDLERALLVGMSPHEKRRLEKKKGLSLKHSGGSVISEKEAVNGTTCIATSAIMDTLKLDSVDVLEGSKEEACNKIDERNLSVMTDTNVSLCSDLKLNGEVSAIHSDSEDMNLDKRRVSETKDNIDLDNNDKNESQTSSNGKADFSYSTSDGTASPKHNSKLSLLGHGPHGKQVVDHILKEHGEDGISHFCQKWRHVFVEAVHPRFLAPGWDVMHSGRRDFGEFSVYNPAKKDFAAAESW